MTKNIKKNGRGSIEVAGVRLLLDFNALCQVEDELGVALSEMGEYFSSGKIAGRDVRLVIRAAMLADNPDVTLEDAGQVVTKIGVLETVQLFPDLFAQSGLVPDQSDDGGAGGEESGAAGNA
ncbi:MAG TPA: hypothetical protein ENK28_04665 [Aliiroseovarius sp.]|nr:hypothetical protein [Aliiroseovarius sp.]